MLEWGGRKTDMGLFQRISDLLRSNINDLISRAEDPEKLLNAAIEEMQKQIIEAKSRVAMSIADEKRLQKHHEAQLAKSTDWEKKAMSAVRAARDDLAVEALAKKKEHSKAAMQFEEQLDSQRAAVDELKKALTELTSKLDETKRKRQILLARAKRAEAQRHVAATLAAAGESSAFERLEKLEAKIERAEAEAEATWEVASLSSGSHDRDLSEEIRLLDAGDSRRRPGRAEREDAGHGHARARIRPRIRAQGAPQWRRRDRGRRRARARRPKAPRRPKDRSRALPRHRRALILSPRMESGTLRRLECLAGLALLACSSPPPPTIPPRDVVGPPLPVANSCLPPYTTFAQDWFILADLDLGTSCRVFLEQDECVLGIYRDCTDPSPNPRQWVGAIDSAMMKDQLEFQIYEGNGTVVGRPPKCCNGRLIDLDWARLDCHLTACDNVTDTIHVGAEIEREVTPDPFATTAGTEMIASGPLGDFALLAAKRELWAITRNAIVVHPLGGTSSMLGSVTDAQHLALAPDEATAYVSDGSKLLRIDTVARTIVETVDLGSRIELLECSTRGVVAGTVDGDMMTVSIRRAGSLATVDAEATMPRLLSIVDLPGGDSDRAFLAAPASGHLAVLTSTLAAGAGAPSVNTPVRALFTVDDDTIGLLAECSERSTAKHCWFEIDPLGGTIRRTGIPDIGDIVDAAYDATRDRVVFSGDRGGLAVLDRARWRPQVQRRVDLAGVGSLQISGDDLYALLPMSGTATHLLLR